MAIAQIIENVIVTVDAYRIVGFAQVDDFVTFDFETDNKRVFRPGAIAGSGERVRISNVVGICTLVLQGGHRDNAYLSHLENLPEDSAGFEFYYENPHGDVRDVVVSSNAFIQNAYTPKVSLGDESNTEWMIVLPNYRSKA